MEADKKKRRGIKAIYKFTAPIQIDNCMYEAHLVVRETPQGRFYYDHNLSQIKKPGSISGKPPERENIHQPIPGSSKVTKKPARSKNLVYGKINNRQTQRFMKEATDRQKQVVQAMILDEDYSRFTSGMPAGREVRFMSLCLTQWACLQEIPHCPKPSSINLL